MLVTGVIHPIPDISTSACTGDLVNVYNYLNTLPYDIELLYPAQFGNDLVLTPHTYLMNAAAAFNGNVYLNAQGNANAVFVIKINGAFSTGTYSKVKLMNGAQEKNVFWKIDGAVSINDYSVFKGMIVCNNAAISLGQGDSLYGRALTTNGAVSTASIVAITQGCNLLPMKLLSFTGERNINNAILRWTTANEFNNAYFIVQKSIDGLNFKEIGTILPGGKPTSSQSYSYTDNKATADKSYYRLQQVDKDGKRQYSDIAEVNMNDASWTLFPNPATNVTHIKIFEALNSVVFTMVNNSGKTVYYRVITKANPGEEIEITLNNLPKGIYLMRMEGAKEITVKKLIVQ